MREQAALRTRRRVAAVPSQPLRRARRAHAARALLTAADAVVVATALGFASRRFPPALPVPLLAAATVAWVLGLRRAGAHRSREIATRVAELRCLVHGTAIGLAGLALLAYWAEETLPRGAVWAAAAVALPGLVVEREVARHLFAAVRRRGGLARAVAVAGTGPEAVALASAFADDPSLGYRVAAFLGDGPVRDARFDGTPVVPLKGKLVEHLQLTGIEGVVVATTDMDLGTANQLSRRLAEAGIHVELSTSLEDIDARRLSVRPLGRFPVLGLEPVRRRGHTVVAKRVFDVVVAGVLLLLALPLLLAAAVAVKLESPGPVLFRQERVGRRGRRFTILKLRSMVVDAESRRAEVATANEADGPLFKVRDDPRVTRVGRVLRRLSVDELPQLVNVLRGEMSLVGPRPALPGEVVQWGPELFERLRVPPGITGMWQVRGRSESRFADYRRWDLYYVDNWSLRHDVAVLLRTVPALLSRRGAY